MHLLGTLIAILARVEDDRSSTNASQSQRRRQAGRATADDESIVDNGRGAKHHIVGLKIVRQWVLLAMTEMTKAENEDEGELPDHDLDKRDEQGEQHLQSD